MNNPEDPAMGTRKVPFSREIWIEQDDFREVPPKGYFRLSPGKEVRLRWGYLITCTSAVKDPTDGRGRRIALHLRSGHARRQRARRPQGERARSIGSRPRHAVQAEVRLYENLFTVPDPSDVPEGVDYKVNLNPEVAGGAAALLPGAEPCRGEAGRPLPVRAAGLFRRRSRTRAGQAGLQPHGVAAGYMGEDREGREVRCPESRFPHLASWIQWNIWDTATASGDGGLRTRSDCTLGIRCTVRLRFTTSGENTLTR